MDSTRSQKGKLTKSVLRSTDVDGDIEISPPEEEAASDLSESFYNVESDLAQTVSNVTLQDFCDLCKLQKESQTSKAEWYCAECDYFLCKQCSSYHKVIKATRSHGLISYDEKMKKSRQRPCRPCMETEDGGKIVPSTSYCRECDDFLCDKCRSYHTTMKVTSGHTLVTSEDRYREEDQKKTPKSTPISEVRLPNVSDMSEKSEKPKRHRQVTSNLGSVVSSKPYIERNAKLIASYNVKISDDESSPDIMGSSFISDSSLVLADCRNRCLKLFHLKDSGLKFITKKIFDGQVWDACVYDASELSVTVDGNIIRLSVTGDEIKDKKTLSKLGFCCMGIDYINKDTLVAVGHGPPTFCVLTTDGTILWKLTTDMEGQPLSDFLWNVALNNSKTMAYMTNQLKDVMFTVDIQSCKVKSCLKLAKGSTPYGVTVDADDNVYICNVGTNTIQQVSKDGVYNRALPTEKVLGQKIISFSPDGNMFMVGGHTENITLFKMR